VLGISYDSPKALMAFKKKYNLPFHFLSDKDKKVARSYGANGLMWPKRITFLIGSDGTIQKIYNKINVNGHAGEILDDIIEKK
jgi:peroxiredoxin Q/BCP|tara:strand:- start:5423 stop:5671 length:249 start_codon:yes stop_codon:yes gene_type:complete